MKIEELQITINGLKIEFTATALNPPSPENHGLHPDQMEEPHGIEWEYKVVDVDIVDIQKWEEFLLEEYRDQMDAITADFNPEDLLG